MENMGESDLSEIYGGSLEIPRTFFDIFEKTLQSHGDEPAVIVTHEGSSYLAALTGKEERPATSCLSWTYRELHYAALQLVAHLAEQYDVHAGATIVTFIPNGIAWPLVIWTSCVGKFTTSSQELGLLTAPRAAELQNVLSRTLPDVVVTVDAEGAMAIDKALSVVTVCQPKVKIVLNVSDQSPTNWVTISSFASPSVTETTRTRIEQSAKDDDPQRVHIIAFTSGTTTGVPKGCPRSVASYILGIEAMYWGAQDHHSRNGITTQNFRSIAVLILFSTFARGGAIVIPGPAFSPSTLLKAMETQRLTMSLFVPAMVHAIVAHPDFEKTDTASMRTVLVGGDVHTRDLYTKTCRAFPTAEVVNAHGMTEGGNVYVWPTKGQTGNRESKLPWHANIATLGRVQVGSRLRIVGDDDRLVKRRELGELHYNNVSFVRHYLDGMKQEDFYTDESGHWIRTGDIGIMNEEGFVWILGRKKDIVKRAGVTINPASLESCLDSFLKSQTSVLAVPHTELGQEPFAVVRDLGLKSKDDVKREIVKLFGDDSALGGVATLKELALVDFPVNGSGKVMKRDLEQPVADFLKAPVKEVRRFLR